MPATENVWRNLRTMHVVFAVSSIAMCVATLWMMERDYADEWRPLQRAGFRLQADQLKGEEKQIDTAEYQRQEKELQARIQQAQAEDDERKGAIARAKKEFDRLDGEFQKLSREVKFQRAERDKARADLDLQVRDGVLGAGLRPWQAKFDEQQAKTTDREGQLQQLQAQLDAAKANLAQLTKDYDEAVAAKKKHETDLGTIQKTLAQIEPTKPAERFKRWLMELPIIDGFNGPLKINQIWLPDLKIGYGGMTTVARFDRCVTCHMNIDKVESSGLPSFPHDPHGVGIDNADEFLHGQRTHDDGTPKGYAHPFSTHPHPELYLTSASPHPMQKFGCTGCHEGQGSGTSFQNASHTPDSPDIGERWRRRYGYVYNHFWEFPMNSHRLAETSCLRCHQNVGELADNPKYGTSAPKLVKGWKLVEQFGCFGCHEINGYSAGAQVGPDLRLEPQTAEEAERIAADPSAVAGKMRKVGPGLRHFASKTTKGWAEYWIEEPKRFHPETRMPQFFKLSNQKDAQAKLLQPVEIAAIAEYLFAKSEPLALDEWAKDYTPDAERGQKLFSQRGCLACHSHGDFPGIKADFGPNLTNAHQKLSSAKWVYTWIRDPTRHSPRTRMPNLFLAPETVNNVTIDPAADIAAFLMANRGADGKLLADDKGKPIADDVGPGRFEPITWDKQGLDELARLYLSKVLTQVKVQETLDMREYPAADAARIKASANQPDEVELVEGEITDEALLRYVGRRTISRYGCYGCHDIPGFEKSRPIGTGLADWGRKDPTKLALEHIEEYLHHNKDTRKGTRDRSTAERAEEAYRDGLNGNLTHEEYEKETAVAFFYDQLLHHGRGGFLWQKLREPRSYDYKKIETKNWDERLRMPKFPFDEQDIESIATFVLGLVADPPAEKYLYRPEGGALARIEGEKLLKKYNCTGCHAVELPEVIGRPSDMAPDELTPADYPQALELLKKLKPPRDARTAFKTKSGEPAIGFHGLLYQPPDPEDDPADQSYYFSLWETLHLGNPDELLLPGRRMELAVKDLVEVKPARGGAFADWLVETSVKADRDLNRDKARQMAPPVLYLEGLKVQTPWLYRFLKNPEQIRYTTVLRMPRFNMSNDEAQTLANYFAAVDNAPFPYQDVPEREPAYLGEQEREHPGYLKDAWKLITMPPPTGVCNGCHAVGGLPFVGGGDPTKVTHAPDLDGPYNRLRPDWAELWIFKPTWITPYTSMPQNFPANKQQFPELFRGDGRLQAIAARDALMNYLQMLEREGKATAAVPPRAPAQGGASND